MYHEAFLLRTNVVSFIDVFIYYIYSFLCVAEQLFLSDSLPAGRQAVGPHSLKKTAPPRKEL